MGLLRNFLHTLAVGRHAHRAAALVAYLESSDPTRLATFKVAASTAMAFLQENSKSEHVLEFPLAMRIPYADFSTQGSELRVLKAYVRDLERLAAEAARVSQPVNQLITLGLPFWIAAFRACYTEELVPFAARMWVLLGRVETKRYETYMALVKIDINGDPLIQSLGAMSFRGTPQRYRDSRSPCADTGPDETSAHAALCSMTQRSDNAPAADADQPANAESADQEFQRSRRERRLQRKRDQTPNKQNVYEAVYKALSVCELGDSLPPSAVASITEHYLLSESDLRLFAKELDEFNISVPGIPPGEPVLIHPTIGLPNPVADSTNCAVTFSLVCDVGWHELRETSDPNIRSCSACNKPVRLCLSEEAARAAATAGLCIAYKRDA